MDIPLSWTAGVKDPMETNRTVFRLRLESEILPVKQSSAIWAFAGAPMVIPRVTHSIVSGSQFLGDPSR
jgi:hypothetical protein